MARSALKDPLDKFRWVVSIQIDGQNSFERAGFTSVETPGVTFNTNTYREGGAHTTPRKIINSIEYKPITLQRGVTQNQDFYEWASSYSLATRGEKVLTYRRTVRIEHKDRGGRTIKTYILDNAIPVDFRPASDFAADADDGLSLERLVIEYESLRIEPTDGASNSLKNSIKDAAKRLTRKVQF